MTDKQTDEHDKLIEAMARGLCNASPFDDDKWEDYIPEATAALNALREKLGYDPQAAFNAGLERAAVIAEDCMVMLSLGSPGDGPFTRQDRAVDEARATIIDAIRAEKEKPQ